MGIFSETFWLVGCLLQLGFSIFAVKAGNIARNRAKKDPRLRFLWLFGSLFALTVGWLGIVVSSIYAVISIYKLGGIVFGYLFG